MKTFVHLSLLAAFASSLWAAPDVSLTVYNKDLALIRETRKMEFKKGTGEILFRDVAARIDATSVHFSAPGVTMLEQNYDYDLVSPEKLLTKYVDRDLEIVSKTGEVARGTLLTSGDDFRQWQIVIKQTDGSLKSILLANTAEIHYPDLPQGLITKPTLRWLVSSESAGTKDAEVSYLTSGLSWHVDYVAVTNDASTQTDLSAWVTVDNTSGASYKDAKLKLLAGEVQRVQTGRPYPQRDEMGITAAKGAEFAEQAFFEYHLYTLQRPTTVLDQQTKQVSLFPTASVATKKLFTYDWRRDSDRVAVSIEFKNDKESGLGMPLPAGRVRVYQKGPDGSEEFVGEDQIEHTPKDEKVTVRVGKAFDIVAERNQKDVRRISERVSETDIEVKLRNHKTDPVEIIVVDQFWGDWEILRSSLTYKKESATKVEFRVSVEPDQEAVLTYTVRTR